MASTHLSRTPSSAGSQTTWTFSAWVKKSPPIASITPIIAQETGDYNSSGILTQIRFNSDKIMVANFTAGNYRDGGLTTQVFRDISGWYHIVVNFNSTDATLSNRIKVYVNGEEAAFNFDLGDTAQNAQSAFNTTNQAMAIGATLHTGTPSGYFDGSMAHVHFIDGTIYDASAFGETDATTGIWKPKTAPSVTYGTNGFFLKFENSGSMGTDSSGNGNNFTVNGTMTQTIDTPSNVFATGNPLYRGANNNLFSNGNLTFTGSSEAYPINIATIQPSAGKWYWETKINTVVTHPMIGMAWNGYTSGGTGRIMYRANGYIITPDATETSGYSSFTNGDIISCALDLDSATTTLKFYKNNTLIYTYNNLTTGLEYSTRGEGMIFWQLYTNDVVSANFGNGYFGTAQVASGNADDNGIGAFEYAPPTGYLALCTKNINAQEYS